ncbi:Hypothetical_protein [Hexamita inflata]|uniref:Hypothetical_protein n=1 Tax=Hexamita inflata TaxID=28002 RepID=A0AA86U0Y3_9EUKA|nr:Hypothetical protein HINF_LOCUS25320 [Hexamita inflata]
MLFIAQSICAQINVKQDAMCVQRVLQYFPDNPQLISFTVVGADSEIVNDTVNNVNVISLIPGAYVVNYVCQTSSGSININPSLAGPNNLALCQQTSQTHRLRLQFDTFPTITPSTIVGDTQIIVTTTPDEYQYYIGKYGTLCFSYVGSQAYFGCNNGTNNFTSGFTYGLTWAELNLVTTESATISPILTTEPSNNMYTSMNDYDPIKRSIFLNLKLYYQPLSSLVELARPAKLSSFSYLGSGYFAIIGSYQTQTKTMVNFEKHLQHKTIPLNDIPNLVQQNIIFARGQILIQFSAKIQHLFLAANNKQSDTSLKLENTYSFLYAYQYATADDLEKVTNFTLAYPPILASAETDTVTPVFSIYTDTYYMYPEGAQMPPITSNPFMSALDIYCSVPDKLFTLPFVDLYTVRRLINVVPDLANKEYSLSIVGTSFFGDPYCPV